MIRSVAVYCSSSKHVAGVFVDAAGELGRAIAQQKWTLVYGGNHIGCMAALADGARAAGGRVIGVTPQLLVDKGIGDDRCDEIIVTPDMRRRKAQMEARADAFIALPGGLGTLEEVFEIIVGRTLELHSKPIVILNIDNYYGPLLAMLDHGIETRFIRARARDCWHVANTVADAVDYLQRTG